MKIKAIIQCRMTSVRFPGKMLAPFCGKPLLLNVINCIKKINENLQIILAISDDTADDPLALYGKDLKLQVVRGPRDDVLKRFEITLEHHKCDAFFRVCGDSPLLYPSLFDLAISVFKKGKYDLVTNIYPRSFPPGITVELIKTKTFIENTKNISDPIDREHVTSYFYKNSKNFNIYNIRCSKNLDLNFKLTIDEPGDLKKIEEWEKKRNEDYQTLFPVM